MTMTPKQKAAAELADRRHREYLDHLKTQWKVPLSREQYAIIRTLLGPGMSARAAERLRREQASLERGSERPHES
ncbi:hypothetical protein RU01_15625 [Rhodococcus sp. MEB064]|nr:hypothetical protein RU01_15625 [Rhodococcus sp. MEB064]